MSTPAQVALLRKLINEPTTDNYTDVELGDLIDSLDGSVQFTAGSLWQQKAAKYASMIDVQEGNSVRKMSQLYQQALKMAAQFNPDALEPLPMGKSARTRAIERV